MSFSSLRWRSCAATLNNDVSHPSLPSRHLDLTRIARGKLTLELRKADAHELLESALEIVRSDIEQRRLTPFVALTASRPYQDRTRKIDLGVAQSRRA